MEKPTNLERSTLLLVTSRSLFPRVDAPVTTELRPLRPPAKTTIMDCTNTAWVVTPIRFPTQDISGMVQAIKRNFVDG